MTTTLYTGPGPNRVEDRGREVQGGGGRKREGETECVCACVCVCGVRSRPGTTQSRSLSVLGTRVKVVTTVDVTPRDVRLVLMDAPTPNPNDLVGQGEVSLSLDRGERRTLPGEGGRGFYVPSIHGGSCCSTHGGGVVAEVEVPQGLRCF